MSKDKLTKKDLQTDQLEEAIVDARDYVVGHRAETAKWAAIAVGAVVLVSGVRVDRRRRDGDVVAAGRVRQRHDAGGQGEADVGVEV